MVEVYALKKVSLTSTFSFETRFNPFGACHPLQTKRGDDTLIRTENIQQLLDRKHRHQSPSLRRQLFSTSPSHRCSMHDR